MKMRTTTQTTKPSDEPRPIDLYSLWIADVDAIVRKAFHSDQRILEDSQHITRGRAAREAIQETRPALRFAAILAASRAPIDDDCLAAAERLAARRRTIRDVLATLAGRQEDEGWDALYGRTRRRTMHALGCELRRLGVVGYMPAYDPYRPARQTANTAMSCEPNAAEDVMA
jgi:hypothetical protein